ncbi:hypothetical protein HY992_05235 [Candidatus Micrarchaeota archaeon]|nr:hypothetical protein [Candidatus Micrarchaeota archaeon]
MKEYGWLEKTPVIKFNEIARRLKSRSYAKVFAHRMMKKGVLKKLIRGVYTASRDVFSVASNIYHPSYISFLSASYLYGFTETIPGRVCIATGKKHAPVEFEGYAIEFEAFEHTWGYHKEKRGEQDVFIVDVEKLLIDAFLKPKAMGNFEEIINVFENSEGINVERLKDYLKKLGSNKIYRQVGCMLEKYKGIDLKGLFPIDKNYYKLNSFENKKGKLDKKWRVLA